MTPPFSCLVQEPPFPLSFVNDNSAGSIDTSMPKRTTSASYRSEEIQGQLSTTTKTLKETVKFYNVHGRVVKITLRDV
jgi:hypothetical protein